MRLKQARVMRQLSLRDLSDELHGAVSHVALAKYEQGLMRPSSDVLTRLCSALGQPPDFFFRPERVSVEKVSFRKRKSFGAKETEALLESVRSRLENYLEAEELIGDTAKLAPKLRDLPTTCERADIRGVARSVREAWGLGDEPIPNLVQLLEDHGVRVVEVDEPSRKFDGCQIEGHDAIATGLRPKLSVARKRFTIAHELGHVLLNKWIRKFRLPDDEADKKMNLFASEFLLPEAVLRRYFSQSRTSITIQELVTLKLRYGISIEAIVYALRALGIIGQNVYERFYRQIVPKWKAANCEPGDEQLKDDEIPQRFRRLVLRGIAEGNISLSRGAGLLGVPLSELRKEAIPIVE
jgi:Zn-dependent peptidase ImmA (M78 family)/transcriptional regulator with XRE-family HTH domain